MLMDAWVEQHLGQRYDASGKWAMTGNVDQALLTTLLSDPYFALAPPKSTGRDLFNLSWLNQHIKGNMPQDVQRTLLVLTAVSITDAVKQSCANADEVYLCGGGADNTALIQCLRQLLNPVKIKLTNDLGININWVEATAFAWLAKQAMDQSAGNLPAVTGAKGPRILGAIYAR
jgi:anhydro-N-acetylmuramic acid kinase